MECTMVEYSHFDKNVKYFGGTHFTRWMRESANKLSQIPKNPCFMGVVILQFCSSQP
jgi:hypothetical protein